MTPERPRVAVVHSPEDAFAAALREALERRAVAVEALLVPDLAACPVTHVPGRLQVGGRRVDGVVVRSRPDSHFAYGFEAEDVGFATGEARALWLALVADPDVVTLNRLDAELWYTSAEWAIWRRRFAAAGQPVAPMAVGDVDAPPSFEWRPWGGGRAAAPPAPVRAVFATALLPPAARTVLWCGGGALPAGELPLGVCDVLARSGVRLASVVLDELGRPLSCTTMADVPPELVTAAAERSAEVLDADLHLR